MDVANKFFVGVQGEQIRVIGYQKLGAPLTKDEAIELAAWLLLLAGDDSLEKVKSKIDEAMAT